MIHDAHGNLLSSNADALVNTVNTVGVMGKGIALQFKRAYPEMFVEYSRLAKTGRIEIGRMFVWPTASLEGPRYIINFPTKKHWRARSKLEYIEAGLRDLVTTISRLGITSIAVPPLGCGNGGLEWDQVRPVIVAALNSVDVEVELYPPSKPPAAAEIIDKRPRPRMTAGRAALLSIMRDYVGVTAHGPSQIEVQKLMYFLQVVAGERLGLHFTQGRYGPYADNLRHVLSELEGHYILGFGDGSAKALEAAPMEVTSAVNVQLIESWLPPETRPKLVRVFQVVSGFESPYSLELLSTVHWVLSHRPEAREDCRVAVQGVQEWNQRKRSTFQPEHIEIAWEALNTRLTPQEIGSHP